MSLVVDPLLTFITLPLFIIKSKLIDLAYLQFPNLSITFNNYLCYTAFEVTAIFMVFLVYVGHVHIGGILSYNVATLEYDRYLLNYAIDLHKLGVERFNNCIKYYNVL